MPNKQIWGLRKLWRHPCSTGGNHWLQPRSICFVSMPVTAPRHALHGGWGVDFRSLLWLSTWIHGLTCSLMRSANVMHCLWWSVPVVSYIIREPLLGSALAPVYARPLSNCTCWGRTKARFFSQLYPGPKARYSLSFRFVMRCLKGSPWYRQSLPFILPSGTPHICPYQIQLRGGVPDLGVPGVEGR